MNNFKRKERYVVLKIIDIEDYLNESQKIDLSNMIETINSERSIDERAFLDCVIVENDWPMYEETWLSIEKWVNK